jgi:hypothetical protein
MAILGEELGSATIPGSSEGLEPLPIVEETEGSIEVDGLGSCNVIKIHDDGDLTVRCGGKKYMVTPEGDIFEESPKKILEPEFISEE